MQEKSQKQIRYENTLLRSQIGEYKSYKLGTLGNIIHWLYVYNLIQYDTVQIGESKVKLHGNLVATYHLDKEKEMPIFKFVDKYDWMQETQDNFIDFL
jgi:hypothetical protein